MINIKSQVVGLERFARKASNRANFLGADGMEDILDKAGADLVERYKKKIESFTPGSVPDLAESTKKQKARLGVSVYPILKRFGTLMDSMFYKVRRPMGGRGWIVAIGFAGSQNGVANARIAQIHIEGQGRNPIRDFTKIPREWGREVFKSIREGLAKI